MSQWVMRRMVYLMDEQKVELRDMDKIFSSVWVSSNELLFATKDFQIKKLKLKRSNKYEIQEFWNLYDCNPSRHHDRNTNGKKGIGIHAITVCPDRTWGNLAVWGAANDIHFKNLKTNVGWSIKVHADTIYSLIMLSQNTLLSGSRDGSLCLTNIYDKSYSCIDLRQGSIRGLSRLGSAGVVGALNSCSGYLETWDFKRGARVRSWNLPKKEELVCIGIIKSLKIESFGECFAIGSQNHVTYVDHRCPNACFSTKINDHGAGVRSLLYKNEYMMVGTGSGRITFFDIRTKKYLTGPSGEQSDAHCLESSGYSWVGSNPYDLNQIENAIYSLKFNDHKNLLFCGGGPIRSNIQGTYAALWRI